MSIKNNQLNLKEKITKKFIESGHKARKGQKSFIRGLTYEQYYGPDKAKEIKSKLGMFGPDNPQYGKPANYDSGAGWSGWYKNWYFRSIYELSFMINYIEKNNLKCKQKD